MKIGDLVRHKRRGWLALVLEINPRNCSADIMWLRDRARVQGPQLDSCSMSLLKVVQ